MTWHDPTHGRIDRDIQQHVDRMVPSGVGQRVALENTLQHMRDNGRQLYLGPPQPMFTSQQVEAFNAIGRAIRQGFEQMARQFAEVFRPVLRLLGYDYPTPEQRRKLSKFELDLNKLHNDRLAAMDAKERALLMEDDTR